MGETAQNPTTNVYKKLSIGGHFELCRNHSLTPASTMSGGERGIYEQDKQANTRCSDNNNSEIYIRILLIYSIVVVLLVVGHLKGEREALWAVRPAIHSPAPLYIY